MSRHSMPNPFASLRAKDPTMTSIPQHKPDKHHPQNRDQPDDVREQFVTPPPEERQSRRLTLAIVLGSILTLFVALALLATL